MNRLVDNILISIATIAVLLSFRHFVGPQITIWSVAMIVAGIIILFLLPLIINGNPTFIKTFLTKTFGLLLLVGGINFLMEHYSDMYWWIYGIAGILIYNFHHLVSDRL